MATHETTGTDHPVTQVRLEPGEQVWLCRCLKSKKFPFCDGSHKAHPGTGPVAVTAPGEAVKK